MHSGNRVYFRAILPIIAAGVAAACLTAATDADAAVAISWGATQNMTCSGGVCAPTAANAVLNTGDLENLLATGNVEVTTTGAGVQANVIDVKAAFGWTNSSALSLDARKSITIDQPVSVSGVATLTLTTNDGGKHGTLSFGKKGNVTFSSLSSRLTINGGSYTLLNSVKGLAEAIAGNPSGDYALAADYDASQDGTYSSSLVPTTFTGNLEGLGNAIRNLTINDPTESAEIGFFTTIGTGGMVANVGLDNLTLTAKKGTRRSQAYVGGIASYNYGMLFGDFESGSIKLGKWTIEGGLVAQNYGLIDSVRSSTSISGKGDMQGGLVGILAKSNNPIRWVISVVVHMLAALPV
ncbi:MAG TPA: hypothetical protein VNX86_12265 [Rhizomicrobium sp.]|jgi:hypothetical protein|nr:hypothetical protein [Rhizomicrobium sp.]